MENIKSRLANKGKPDNKLSARKGGDIELVKSKPIKVPHFNKDPVGNNKRVVNNAFLPYRMKPAKINNMMYRQELAQNQVKQPQEGKINLQFVGSNVVDEQKKEEIKKDPDNKFVRVSNNLFRGEESVLDQNERYINNVNVKRELANQLNGLKINEHEKIAKLVKSAHMGEQKVEAENEKRFLSKFTGETQKLVEEPELKQQLDQNMNITKRAAPSLEQQKFNEGVEQFANKYGINKDFIKGFTKGFTPDPRMQAEMQREQQ